MDSLSRELRPPIADRAVPFCPLGLIYLSMLAVRLRLGLWLGLVYARHDLQIERLLLPLARLFPA